MKGITWGETMIDTDKYEGHIQGEWRDTIHEGAKAHHINAEDVKICTVFPNEATANLVADAPLLLDFIVWVKNTHPHYYNKLTKAYQGAKNNR